jgi:hypothetical protein
VAAYGWGADRGRFAVVVLSGGGLVSAATATATATATSNTIATATTTATATDDYECDHERQGVEIKTSLTLLCGPR